ncbi:hypothetical protein O7626_22605 [Micromonospora sp. WMMD1102]|uniref:hypothetical protein n=1 Tax=Micromonospora sp. WMMD1102 TaxID=3016105 RepID=UPI0024150F9B|nr:hypothetical protein [Micromonospora sp. WMMD1102]MDG4788681.1 hypothetical protein [Micromonospora sp. WMMD1102]
MTDKTYRVVVTREPRAWLADISDLAGGHTYARNPPGLDDSVRQVIAMIEDLPEGAEPDLEIDYDYRTGEYDTDPMAVWLRLRH